MQNKKHALLIQPNTPFEVAAEIGFEPIQNESESCVLPVHQSAI